MQHITISPSILASDFANLAHEMRLVEQAGADWVHIDVMDGHFVPNISLGSPVVKSLRAATALPFDVHLMITDPIQYAKAFAKAGADIITIHIETVTDVNAAVQYIRSLGVRVGLSIKPKTPAQAVFPYLDDVDMVLIMTVEPGFGGQKFMGDMLEKVRAVRAESDKRGLTLDIEVDGGVDEKTAPLCCEAGANVLVAGSAIFGKENYKAAIAVLKNDQ
ncbi:MAG: ribulose-phosphate 3-epimerase [Acetanaerobacterium sp.]